MPISFQRRRLASLLIFGLLIFHIPLPLKADESTLVIGEIQWAGSSLSSADEWLELWNLSREPITLRGYQLTGASGTRNMFFGSSDIVPARSAFLISNYDASDTKSILNIIPNMVTSSISLPNDKLKIQLLDPQGLVIDQAGNGLTPFAGSNDGNKSSMIRMIPLLSGDQPGAWFTATNSRNFDVGVATLGTPGFCDGCITIPTGVTSTAIVTTSTVMEQVTSTNPVSNSIPSPSSTIDTPAISTNPPPTIIDYGPQHPVASFSVAGEFRTSSTIMFDATSSSDPNGDILNFVWEFGDGLTATTTRVTHTYTTSSNFIVSLTASDGTFFDTVTTSLTIAPQPIIPLPPPAPILVRLNEIYPYPSGGAEWVELSALSVTTTLNLQGWQLEDAKSVIFHFSSSTWNASSSYLQIELNGSHLNNDGDLVRLRDNFGRVIDESSYPDFEKNQSWIRSPDEQGGWHVSEMATPAQPNIWIPPKPPLRHSMTQDETQTPRRVTIVKYVTQKIPAPASITEQNTATISPPPTTEDDSTATTVMRDEIQVEATPPQSIKNKKPTKKVHDASAAKVAHVTTIPMLSHLDSQTRVELTGTVASMPKLLSGHQFVLQTEDGRGLLVQGNGKTASPPFGLLARMQGTLLINDDGISLHMGNKDQWSMLKQKTVVQPRVVDLLTPSQEDAWSLVEVTGTVRAVDHSLIHLDAQEASVTVYVRPVIHYRAERLQVGDVIRVRGLLDTRGEEPKIFPRLAEEITLLKEAKKATSSSAPQTSGLPPWTPIGSAGATMALAQGVKYVRKVREGKRLAKLLAEASNNLS